MSFNTPIALLLFLVLIPVIWLGRPTRGLDRKRELTALMLRLILLACLILALAGLQVVNQSNRLAVVFLLDMSDSMPTASKNAAIEYIRSAVNAMGANDQAALITFGGNALVDRSMSSLKELETIRSIPITNQTDLAEAIQLASALYPSHAARRMVILSDGNTTTGDAQTAARYASSSGIEIVALPFYRSLSNEFLISEVDAPESVNQNESFSIHATIEASQPGTAIIRVSAEGKIIYQQEHRLNRGNQTLSLPVIAGEPGFTSYLVQLETGSDTYYQNNESYAYTQVSGPPAILVVNAEPGESTGQVDEPPPDESAQLIQALQSAGLIIQSVRASEIPTELPLLAEYKAVILVNIPARQLSNRQMRALQTYVRDLGGGLLAIGGPSSFGVGGYYRTPLEETLPVDMQIKDEQRRPSLAIVFVIDHSGSMSDLSGGVTKIELAKEAAIRSVELLTPSDRVGVVAFDDSASWVVEMSDLQDRQQIINAIGTIRGGGGTDILAGLQAMAAVLPGDESKVKHVILLTDGGADPTGIPELVQRLYAQNGITLSTVGVGRDAAPYLSGLAELGGGRFHFTAEPATIPAIFTEETTLATRAYLIEETFYPQLVTSSPIMANLNETPALHGYVGTSGKDTAQIILNSTQGDPILAVWQYGLGRSAAFTSDATGRWGGDWVSWEGFAPFWSQVVGYITAQGSSSQIEANINQNGDAAQIILDAHQIGSAATPEGQEYFLNGYAMQANVVEPGGESQTISLRQTAPGRYVGDFKSTEQGVYLIHVTGTDPSPSTGQSISDTFGWVLSYSPEYRSLEAEPDDLYRIVAANGGKIASENPVDIFAHTLTKPRTKSPIWPGLLLTAVLLLPFDIAVRRLVVTREDLMRWLKKPMHAQPTSQRQTGDLPRQKRIESLFRAKERTILRQRVTESSQDKPAAATDAEESARKRSLASIEMSTPHPPEEVETRPGDATHPDDEQNTAARLLERKRERQEQRQKRR